MKTVLNTDINLYERNGIAYCDSLQIAKELDKRHGHILRDIESQLSDIALSNQPKFGEINFVLDMYKDRRNRKQKRYLLTKDGFVFLVTSYGGKKATDFKISYIQRFNDMEEYIKSIQTAKMEFPALTQAIKEAHDEPKSYYFSNELNMINRIVLGTDAKHFKQEHGIDVKENSIRPYLAAWQIKAVQDLQRADIGLVMSGMDFQDRKILLVQYFNNCLIPKGVNTAI